MNITMILIEEVVYCRVNVALISVCANHTSTVTDCEFCNSM